jgi:hypothetical protein
MTSRSKVPSKAPLYVRALRLRQLRVGGLASVLLFECMIAVGVLLALAELVSWWAVLILPVVVAIMVKVNDIAASAAARGRANREGRSTAEDSASRSGSRSSAKRASRLDEWDDWDELTAPEKHGTTSLSRAELDRAPAEVGAGGGRKSTPLARALARQQAQAALGDDGRSSVPMPEPPPVAPPPATQMGVTRIWVPARDKVATGRATPPQQESRRAARHDNQQEGRSMVSQPAARSGTYEDGGYDDYERADYGPFEYDRSSGPAGSGYDGSGYDGAEYGAYDHEPRRGAHRSGYLGVNDSFHNDAYHNEAYQADESPTGGRHARGYRSGGHYSDDAFTSSGGRHSDNGRRDDDITRQRSTLNQGRFA